MSRLRSLPLCAVAAALLAAPRSARAEHEIARGAVVKIEQQEVYVALGTKQGVADGAPLRLKRPLRLRHPVTKAMVEDWIPLGSATVTQAGASLSRAVLGQLAGELRPGDLAEVLIEVQAPTPLREAPPASPAPTPPAPRPDDKTPAPTTAADPAAVEVLELFSSLTGAPLDARIAAWERYLSTTPGSPYAGALRQELDALRRLRDELTTPVDQLGDLLQVKIRHRAPLRASAGEPVALVFVLDQPERVASAFLYYRTRGERTFHAALLGREHDRYLRGQIPGELMVSPGVEYFVEASAPSGSSGLALGAPDRPLQIAVPAPPLTDRFGAEPGRSTLRLTADYQSFASLDERPGDYTDRLFTASVDFTYRMRGAVESLGVGYGVLSGRGGGNDTLWTEMYPPLRTGFHYGYAEIEVGAHERGNDVGLALRLIAGVSRLGFGLGAEARVRVGAGDGVHLQLVARSIEDHGFLSEVRFGAPLARRLRMRLSVGATDLPAKLDTGAVLGSEVEWDARRNLSLHLRGTWQGRSIDHSGLGAGVGLGVSW